MREIWQDFKKMLDAHNNNFQINDVGLR